MDSYTYTGDGTPGGTLLQKSDYVVVNQIPNSPFTDPNTGEQYDLHDAGGKDIYGWRAGINDVYGWYTTNTPTDYYDTYIGFDIRAIKRLSNKWMLMGSFTLQDQKNYWGDTYPLNPSNAWAYDGKLYGYQIGGGSGKMSMRVFSRWMFKAQGLYQLPYDFNVSFTFNARQGHMVDEYISVRDDNAPNPYDTGHTMPMRERGKNRLPTFWNFNLRLEKILRVGDVGKVYLMIDAFNVFNSNILNRQRDINPGTIYLHNTPPTMENLDIRSGEANEVLNPRVFRFGLRFQF
jgi:hypothetical protein